MAENANDQDNVRTQPDRHSVIRWFVMATVGVLLISAELDEIMSLADRIAVIYRGQILDVLPAAEATREELGLLMAGVERQPA